MDWFPSGARAGGDVGVGISDDPPATFWTKWFGGVAVPVFLVAYAAWGLVRGEIWFPTSRSSSAFSFFGQWIDGPMLWCAAGVLVGIAMVLHAYGFWGQRYASDHATVYLGKLLGMLLALVSCVIWLFICVSTG